MSRLGILAATLALAILTACGVSNSSLTAISVTPSTTTVLAGVGQTAQLSAVGTYHHGSAGSGHPDTSSDVTTSAQWSSSNTSVATVSAGLVTAVAGGTATITASLNGVTGTANVVVAAGGGGSNAGLTALTIIPAAGASVLTTPDETAQYLAIGTFSTPPTTQDMTGHVTWISSDVSVATIDSNGLATAGSITQGVTTITALAVAGDGSVITGTSDLTTGGSGGGGQLPTLAVYAVGQGTGMITSVPAGISCTTGAGCTGYFTLGTVVTLTATANPGSHIGGFSSNCNPPTVAKGTTMASCTVTAGNNTAVGVIFDQP